MLGQSTSGAPGSLSPEVIDLCEETAEEALTTASASTPGTDKSLFASVSLQDLDIGDRLGARRDGGEGFQVSKASTCFQVVGMIFIVLVAKSSAECVARNTGDHGIVIAP